MNRLPIVLVLRPRSRARSSLFEDEDELSVHGLNSRPIPGGVPYPRTGG